MTQRLYHLGATISRSDGATLTSSMVTGWRIAVNREEAVGSFVESVKRLKPEFSIDDVTAAVIPEDALRELVAGWSAAGATPLPESNT